MEDMRVDANDQNHDVGQGYTYGHTLTSLYDVKIWRGLIVN